MHFLTVDRTYGVDHCDVTLIAGIIAGLFDQIAGWTLFGVDVTALPFGRNPIFLTQAAIKPPA
jgi:hypothetical protein